MSMMVAMGGLLLYRKTELSFLCGIIFRCDIDDSAPVSEYINYASLSLLNQCAAKNFQACSRLSTTVALINITRPILISKLYENVFNFALY